jgi:uncharacterized ferritin-like protein (DUF455 family)
MPPATASAPPPTAGLATAPLAPPADTLEGWAYRFLATTDLEAKLSPPPVPRVAEAGAAARRIDRPGRPPQLTVVDRAPKSPKAGALRDPHRRAQALHTFLHHELQAAELMAWAILAFPEAPAGFRRGLVRVLGDELRHVRMYQAELVRHGHQIGDFPVRDWFWQRVPLAASPAHFAAVMGMGLEAANLDHAPRFAALFRAVGDEQGARVQEQVAEEEIPHVRFGVRWFERLVLTPHEASPPAGTDTEIRLDGSTETDIDDDRIGTVSPSPGTDTAAPPGGTVSPSPGTDTAAPPGGTAPPDAGRRIWPADAFRTWASYLPPPLSPLLMRGAPMSVALRERAGFSREFLDELQRWAPREAGEQAGE